MFFSANVYDKDIQYVYIQKYINTQKHKYKNIKINSQGGGATPLGQAAGRKNLAKFLGIDMRAGGTGKLVMMMMMILMVKMMLIMTILIMITMMMMVKYPVKFMGIRHDICQTFYPTGVFWANILHKNA